MGTVHLNGVEVGTFEPQVQGGYGKVYLSAVEVGTFNFTEVSGNVYLNGIVVGGYSGLIPTVTTVGFIQPKVINPKIVTG